MYLKLRYRQWWACHDIPKNLRDIIGRGARFAQPLNTEDKKTAQRRAAVLEVQWLSEIEKAKKGTRDHIEQDASFWQKTLKEAPEEHKEIILDLIADEAESKINRALDKAGFIDYREEGAMDLPEVAEANRFFNIATGKLVKMEAYLDEWLATLSNEQKSKDMKKSTVLKFSETFPYVSDVNRKKVQRWINSLHQEEGKKPATISRALSEVRGYWNYLTAIEVVSEDNLPLEKLALPKDGIKEKVREERKAFVPEEVVSLLKAATAKGDFQLANLIQLGMWTGARLEELCSLKLDHVGDGYIQIIDAKSKAGWRRVPIHPKLTPTLTRLVEASKKAKDDYVLMKLTENKYGDRSNAIGKRFGHLKTDEGFSPQHVFHSIRHTVATMFKSLRVEEALAADILGHEHANITFGVYASEQARMETLTPIVGLLDYPGV